MKMRAIVGYFNVDVNVIQFKRGDQQSGVHPQDTSLLEAVICANETLPRNHTAIRSR